MASGSGNGPKAVDSFSDQSSQNHRGAQQCTETDEVRVPSAERPSRLSAVFGGHAWVAMTSSYDRAAAEALFATKLLHKDHAPDAVRRGVATVVAQNVLAIVSVVFLTGVAELARSLDPGGSTPGGPSFLTNLYRKFGYALGIAALAIFCAAQVWRRHKWALRLTEVAIVWRAWLPLPHSWFLLHYYFDFMRSGMMPGIPPFTGTTLAAFLVWTIGGIIALYHLESRESRAWFRRGSHH